MARCTRCDSTNVDYEGYCWSCEYQAPVPAAAEPEPASLPEQPLVEAPVRRSATGRALIVVSLVVVAFVSTVASLVVAIVFRSNADSIAAQVNDAPLASPVVGVTGSAAPSADPGAACLPGSWKAVKSEGEYQFTSIGTVHASGSGGMMIFRPDGTGTWDVNGYTETGVVKGKRIVVTASGTVDFSYKIYSPRIQYTDIVSKAKSTVTIDGASAGTTQLKMVSYDNNRYTCEGNSLKLNTGEATIDLARIA